MSCVLAPGVCSHLLSEATAEIPTSLRVELIHSWFGESSLHTPSPDSSAAALVTALKSSKMLRSRGKLQILPVKWQLAWKDHESPAAGWIGRGKFSRVFNGGKLKE